jgi:phage terminase small subunit
VSTRQLSERERRFVEAYMGKAAGNATEAAILAGYKRTSARQQGSRLLTKASIRNAVEQRASSDPKVMTRAERQQFWSAVAWGTGKFSKAPIKDRLKASELLGRAQADFVERHEHSGTIAVHDVRASLAEKLAKVAHAGPA